MKKILRVLSLALILAISIGICSCADEKTDGKGTKESKDTFEAESQSESSDSELDDESQDEESKSSTSKKTSNTQKKSRIYKKDLDKYKFVISAEASNELKTAVERVCRIATQNWGIQMEFKTDDYATGKQEAYEILVGETNRNESTKYKTKLKSGEGGYTIDQTKIVILGYTENETISALNLFCLDRAMIPIDDMATVFFMDGEDFKADLSKYVSVMSFNVYVGIQDDNAKKANAIKLIRDYSPDVFGVQEASAPWQTTLKNEFSKDYHISS